MEVPDAAVVDVVDGAVVGLDPVVGAGLVHVLSRYLDETTLRTKDKKE